MTRKEMIDLLEIISAAYPYVKISDPASMVSAWLLVFGDQDAGAVYKAARLHIETSHFFPTPADINNLMVKAGSIYGSKPFLPFEPVNFEPQKVVLTTGGAMELAEKFNGIDLLDDIWKDLNDD